MRAGGFLFCVWRLKGFTVCLPSAHNYPVGANIVRPQHDRSLCKERPHIRLTITWEHNVLPYGITCTDRIATVRRGRTPGHLLLPFGQFTLSHPTVIFNRFRCCWIWTRNAHPTMSYATAGKRCRFDLKKLFQKNLKKGLTKRGFCYILNKSSAMSHQKRQQLNKMESWLSGRRRTIGNRVGVMSVSRVQIPNSPP